MTKHFVEFLYPGVLFAETTSKEISKRDDELVKLPKGAFGYRFYDQSIIVKDGDVFYGNPKNYSSTRYFGKVYTAEEIKEKYPDEKILLNNMKYNNIKHVVKTIRGNWQPLRDEDIVFEK